MSKELWKLIEAHGTKYSVSTNGRVRNNHTNKILSSSGSSNNLTHSRTYYSVKLNGIAYNVHRLIAQAFLPNPENYRVVNHIDGNRHNNNIENLEWCSHSLNTKHSHRTNEYKRTNPNTFVFTLDADAKMIFNTMQWANRELDKSQTLNRIIKEWAEYRANTLDVIRREK